MNYLLSAPKLDPLNWETVKDALTILWQGLLAIFVVIAIIIAIASLVFLHRKGGSRKSAAQGRRTTNAERRRGRSKIDEKIARLFPRIDVSKMKRTEQTAISFRYKSNQLFYGANRLSLFRDNFQTSSFTKQGVYFFPLINIRTNLLRNQLRPFSVDKFRTGI
ncbi:MAG: hypothetical protein ACLS4Z_05175 [Christensenellaceae bacterium]